MVSGGGSYAAFLVNNYVGSFTVILFVFLNLGYILYYMPERY